MQIVWPDAGSPDVEGKFTWWLTKEVPSPAHGTLKCTCARTASAALHGCNFGSCMRCDVMQDMHNRMTLDMDPHSRSIEKSHVLTIHGDRDSTIPVEDAFSFHKRISVCALGPERMRRGTVQMLSCKQQPLARGHEPVSECC